ncbi:MAG TPA: thiamine-phosphate kinase [Thermoanaerobaculia bacterium]|nr:thiamine-phosphate kinase [Thermoanaerobaculia bacterium]
MKEADIVALVRELFPQRGAKVGIGDDAAVVGEHVVTTDMLIEDVDFTRAIPLRFVARKSLAVNLSDLAAMGALPAYAVVALGLPPWTHEHIDEFLEALAGAAREQDIDLVGGDLSRAEKLTIAVTAVGYVEHRPLLRSGARAGDRVYLSRPVGGSAAGLWLLQHGGGQALLPVLDRGSQARVPDLHMSYAQREFGLSAIRRQVDPEPEVRLGRELAQIDEVSACIDVSDGLSTDLHHLCEASHVGADIERERIPVFPDLVGSGLPVEDCVLHGGEEYALLFTSSLRESELSVRVGRPVYAIGKISKERGVRLNGKPLEAKGWEHF